MPSLLCGLMSHQVVLSHFVHLNGISPKWILSWVSNLKISSNLKLRSSCTLFALEWLLSCVGPLMFLQVPSYWEALVALSAFKRLLSFVGPLMLLQVASYWEALVVLSHFEHLKGFSPVWVLSLRAFERLLPCMGPLMLLQGTWCWKHLSHFAPLPHLNLSWVDPLMGFQVTWCKEALVTLCALEWLFSHVGSLMFLQVGSYWAALVALWSFINHPLWVLSFLYCL